MTLPQTTLISAISKDYVPSLLNSAIVPLAANAIAERGAFSLALSGGSLASFLSSLEAAFEAAQVAPKFECWHVILADERCVAKDHQDSNLGSLENVLFSKIPSIPSSQIHGINQEKIEESSAAVALDYAKKVASTVEKTGGQLDLAVLGFGPDGHTCSLFPDHVMLKEETLWVSSLDDSPKPPPSRISLTLPFLNQLTRHVIFCGAGGSKSPILQAVFSKVESEQEVSNGKKYAITVKSPPPYPCAMVLPDSKDTENTVTWVVDADAMKDLTIISS